LERYALSIIFMPQTLLKNFAAVLKLTPPQQPCR
jgi:hypothetical protein